MEKLCRIIEDKLRDIAEKGLTTGNLETAYRLVDMYKDLKNTSYWNVKADYYSAVLNEMDSGYSQRGRKRNRYGRYSAENEPHRDERHYSATPESHHDDRYTRYMDSKHSYRSGRSTECKQRLMDTLEDYMEEFSEQMEEMLKDADCAEERETIKRYLSKIKGVV